MLMLTRKQKRHLLEAIVYRQLRFPHRSALTVILNTMQAKFATPPPAEVCKDRFTSGFTPLSLKSSKTKQKNHHLTDDCCLKLHCKYSPHILYGWRVH